MFMFLHSDVLVFFFFFSSRRRHTRLQGDWSSDVCSSDLAWRELARRLAHELRNPLFPMHITVENLQKARQLDAKQFLEVFHESTATLKIGRASCRERV